MGSSFPSMMGINRPAVDNFFFSEGNKKMLFYNFNTATHGATFNHVFKLFF
jgi:hypothetical protein